MYLERKVAESYSKFKGPINWFMLRRWNFICVSLREENLNNLTTCKSSYIFDVFLFCFTEFKVKKCKQTQNKRKPEKQAQKNKKNHLYVAFECFIWSYRVTSGVNCVCTDRVTCDWCGERFWFLLMQNDYRGFSLNPALFEELCFKPLLET